MATDIYQYGQAKAGPTEILMIAAESSGTVMRDLTAEEFAGARNGSAAPCSTPRRYGPESRTNWLDLLVLL
jgi:hypothetical protein